jgi:hypothetical protein
MFCVIAALAVAAHGANAGTVTPKINVQTPKVQVNPQPLPPRPIMSIGTDQVRGTANGAPHEKFGLSYDKLDMQYQTQTPGAGNTGKVHGHYKHW